MNEKKFQDEIQWTGAQLLDADYDLYMSSWANYR